MVIKFHKCCLRFVECFTYLEFGALYLVCVYLVILWILMFSCLHPSGIRICKLRLQVFMVTINRYYMLNNLLVLHMVGFEVILGMDWLSLYHTILDCRTEIITLMMMCFPRLE